MTIEVEHAIEAVVVAQRSHRDALARLIAAKRERTDAEREHERTEHERANAQKHLFACIAVAACANHQAEYSVQQDEMRCKSCGVKMNADGSISL